MRSKFLLFAFLLFTSIGLSQTVDVTGTVLDSSTGEVLVGTNIFINNSQTGISTDIDGNFKITGVPVGSTIVFTYLGYKDFEYKVSKSESITNSKKTFGNLKSSSSFL